jgi:hypothetical protein
MCSSIEARLKSHFGDNDYAKIDGITIRKGSNPDPYEHFWTIRSKDAEDPSTKTTSNRQKFDLFFHREFLNPALHKAQAR